jgi:chromosome segregation protein
VTLVLDNSDRLLPVDYGEVELGRRLYRSGENEYLLNRQRIRLRDLTELLDAGNLADNAFLFIGQGMVDQALALRPEERRPLFEEAAGVRRHERRRRQAENELAEAELNLERLRDVLAELRPQARRLAAQAEQLEARQTAGLELAEALVATARARWADAAPQLAREQAALEKAHADADAAMAELRAGEQLAEQLSAALGDRAERERHHRLRLDELRGRTLDLRLSQTRRLSELEALVRDRERLGAEGAALEARVADARRVLAQPLPEMEGGHGLELEEVERELADMARTLERQSADQAAIERTQRDRQLLLERLRQQADEADRRLGVARPRAEAAATAAHGAAADRDGAVARLAEAGGSAAEAEQLESAARAAMEARLARHAAAERDRAESEALVGAVRARLGALEDSISASIDPALARQARARGGSLIAEGLEVEPGLRVAIAAALGEAARGLAVEESAAPGLRDSRGLLLLPAPPPGARRAVSRATDSQAALAAAQAAITMAQEAGGGRLAEGLRRDPAGNVGRLLERALWVPDLDAALTVRPHLLPGWRVVTLAGEVIGDEGLLRLAGADPYLQLRAERDELVPERDRLTLELDRLTAEAGRAAAERRSAEQAWQAARVALDEARRERRVAEETERAAQRRAEATERESAWEQERLARLAREAESARARLTEVEAEATAEATADGDDDARPIGGAGGSELAARLAAARARRERLLRAQADEQARVRAVEEAHRRAEVSAGIDEARVRELDAERERLASREAELTALRDRLAAELATSQEAEQRAAAELERLLGEAADERSRLMAAERAAADARERLRTAESRSRSAEVSAMEARLQLEALREQLLVELAGIGADAFNALREGHGPVGVMASPPPDPEHLAAALEAALGSAIERWQEEPAGGAAPSSVRLGMLRRRFHELGAGNPFAADEYAEVRDRLAAFDAQREDMETAIRTTRELIERLSTLIAEQFRQTFSALEGAFARRFHQLFDGGEAQLSLTAPEDLSATGVEITARPPGKKRQPLAMLSGGERALTAVALLLAMLEVRPVPFCVLDEVDAALDEANVARFQAALRSLSHEIQFIVITHNRGTIEGADALYGVTIGEDAVSRIVSLRLPPADGPHQSESRATVGG